MWVRERERVIECVRESDRVCERERETGLVRGRVWTKIVDINSRINSLFASCICILSPSLLHFINLYSVHNFSWQYFSLSFPLLSNITTTLMSLSPSLSHTNKLCQTLTIFPYYTTPRLSQALIFCIPFLPFTILSIPPNSM